MIEEHGKTPTYTGETSYGFGLLLDAARLDQARSWNVAEHFVKKEEDAPPVVEKPMEHALVWYARAAWGGNYRAQSRLGWALLGGQTNGSRRLARFVRPDPETALKLLRRLQRDGPRQKRFKAQDHVAEADALAFWVPARLRRPKQAAKLYQDQIDATPWARRRLAYLHWMGYGVPYSDVRAEELLWKALAAVRHGRARVKGELAEVILFGQQELTPERRIKARNLLLSGQESPRTQYVLARAFRDERLKRLNSDPDPDRLFAATLAAFEEEETDRTHDRLLIRSRMIFEGWGLDRPDRQGAIQLLRAALPRSRHHPLLLTQLAWFEYRARDRSKLQVSDAILQRARQAAEAGVARAIALYVVLLTDTRADPAELAIWMKRLDKAGGRGLRKSFGGAR